MKLNRVWMRSAGVLVLGVALAAPVFAFGHWSASEHDWSKWTHRMRTKSHHQGGAQAAAAAAAPAGEGGASTANASENAAQASAHLHQGHGASDGCR